MTDSVAATAKRAARAGGEVADAFFRGDLTIEYKDGKTDVVTTADRRAQLRIVDELRETRPDATIVGEEDGLPSAVPSAGRAWIVDPIDGTNNFVRGARCWATSVALLGEDGPIAAANALPACGDTYVAGANVPRRNGDRIAVSDRADPERCVVAPTVWWSRDRRAEYEAVCRAIVRRFGDLRRVGSTQATLSMVADGTLDGAVTDVETNAWDTVAGAHLVREAGGRVTDPSGRRWKHDSIGLVASNGAIHDELLDAMADADGE